MNIPIVVEKTSSGEQGFDIYSRLLRDRIIFIGNEIDYEMASNVIAQLLFLQTEDKSADINLYIMSPGGAVGAGLAIYDTMQMLSNDICTWGVGEACSMGAFLLAAGTKGKRYALASTRIMLHQPYGGTDGSTKDIEIQAKEMKRLTTMLTERLSLHTGQPLKRIKKDIQEDYYMGSEEAKEYGIVDKVVHGRKR